jgi:hypothetical protein
MFPSSKTQSHTVFDAAISRLMTSVHSKLVQSRQYALLTTTSQRHCISNVCHDPGCPDDVAWICLCRLAQALGWIEYSVALNCFSHFYPHDLIKKESPNFLALISGDSDH